jgi:hypothetical protein
MGAQFVFGVLSLAFGLAVILAVITTAKHVPGTRANSAITRIG